ncbi:MAG: DUF1611 domain-containing protein, partial [Spirochaetales bacterium]|nr:DUF1611 domain-containing protein [Spirochaetales bacterium]
MNKVKVAIIDSGVNQRHVKLKNDNIKGFSINRFEIRADFQDYIGHGTAIYNIIRENLECVEITNIRIDSLLTGMLEDELVFTLQYIYDNLDINVINISMGLNVLGKNNHLEEICERLRSKNIIIVAAFDNDGSISYPAHFESVIGVTDGKYCRGKSDFEYVESKHINICAKGSVQRVAWLEPEYLMIGGNSFACAHVTNQVIKFMEKGILLFSDILASFERIGRRKYTLDKFQKTLELPRIHNAALIPFVKEMHALVRFEEMLPFKIMGVYDFIQSGMIGSTTRHILADENVGNHIIRAIEEVDLNTIDSLIIGSMEAFLGTNKIMNAFTKMIKEARDKKINIIAMDQISIYFDLIGDDYYFPEITIKNVRPNPFGKLFRVGIPVVGVYGTSSKQGKFTLQLLLRRKLQEKKYLVGQIGTEPTALLFEMDYVYPCGYNSTVKIGQLDEIRYLNRLI